MLSGESERILFWGDIFQKPKKLQKEANKRKMQKGLQNTKNTSILLVNMDLLGLF